MVCIDNMYIYIYVEKSCDCNTGTGRSHPKIGCAIFVVQTMGFPLLLFVG